MNRSSSPNKRVVLFVGPHKSASSTVQEFFVQYATGRRKYRKVSAFREWRWPVLSNSPIPTRKQLAQLVIQQSTTNNNKNTTPKLPIHQLLHDTITNTYQTYPNLVLGTEEFDRIGSTPWSHRNGPRAIRELPLPNPKRELDVVVNYRVPRAGQWISIWKQLTAMDQLPFKDNHTQQQQQQQQQQQDDVDFDDNNTPKDYLDWICQEDPIRLWEYLDCVANPMRLAHELLLELEFHKLYLIDMGGVAERRLDVSHVSACRVLRVPCDARQEWVRGIQNRTLVYNSKSAPMSSSSSSKSTTTTTTTTTILRSDEQWEEMEWLFRQRDCAYQNSLQRAVRDGRMEILTPSSSLWKDCKLSSNTNDDDGDEDDAESSASKLLLNTSFFLELLQSQGTCAGRGSGSVNVTEWKARQQQQQQQQTTRMGRNAPSETFKDERFQSPRQEILTESTAAIHNNYDYDWILVQLVQWFLVLFLFGSFFQKRVCRSRSS
jgi:hypothetical protein